MQIGMILKLLSMVSLFKDVTKEVQAAGAEKRPWYMQRSVWGSILAAVGGIGAAFFGFSLDAATIETLTDNIPQLIGAGIAVYGTILSVYGAVAKLFKKPA